MISETVLNEIDSTLEQLIKNAEILSQAEFSALSELELEAFQKTQESLLHHWMRMDRILQTSSQQGLAHQKNLTTHRIAEKAKRFKLLEPQVATATGEIRKKHSLFTKRRHKKLLREN